MGGAPGSLLYDLVGEELTSVVFVREYVQLDFGGPRLSVFVWPRVTVDGRIWTIEDRGYRDALCSLIGHIVVSVAEAIGIGLVIGIGAGTVTIKPVPTDLVGPEIALLSGFMGRDDWMVWRPAEGPFSGPEW